MYSFNMLCFLICDIMVFLSLVYLYFLSLSVCFFCVFMDLVVGYKLNEWLRMAKEEEEEEEEES